MFLVEMTTDERKAEHPLKTQYQQLMCLIESLLINNPVNTQDSEDWKTSEWPVRPVPDLVDGGNGFVREMEKIHTRHALVCSQVFYIHSSQ